VITSVKKLSHYSIGGSTIDDKNTIELLKQDGLEWIASLS